MNAKIGESQKLIDVLKSALSEVEMDSKIKDELINSINSKVFDAVSLYSLQEKLRLLYEYEKYYLDLLKEYKEEIKFAATLQEDLRKERANFFAESLKEVSSTLANAQIDSNVASVWIKELVECYTKSLDLSQGLVEESTLDMIGQIRQKAKNTATKASFNKRDEGEV